MQTMTGGVKSKDEMSNNPPNECNISIWMQLTLHCYRCPHRETFILLKLTFT